MGVVRQQSSFAAGRRWRLPFRGSSNLLFLLLLIVVVGAQLLWSSRWLRGKREGTTTAVDYAVTPTPVLRTTPPTVSPADRQRADEARAACDMFRKGANLMLRLRRPRAPIVALSAQNADTICFMDMEDASIVLSALGSAAPSSKAYYVGERRPSSTIHRMLVLWNKCRGGPSAQRVPDEALVKGLGCDLTLVGRVETWLDDMAKSGLCNETKDTIFFVDSRQKAPVRYRAERDIMQRTAAADGPWSSWTPWPVMTDSRVIGLTRRATLRVVETYPPRQPSHGTNDDDDDRPRRRAIPASDPPIRHILADDPRQRAQFKLTAAAFYSNFSTAEALLEQYHADAETIRQMLFYEFETIKVKKVKNSGDHYRVTQEYAAFTETLRVAFMHRHEVLIARDRGLLGARDKHGVSAPELGSVRGALELIQNKFALGADSVVAAQDTCVAAILPLLKCGADVVEPQQACGGVCALVNGVFRPKPLVMIPTNDPNIHGDVGNTGAESKDPPVIKLAEFLSTTSALTASTVAAVRRHLAMGVGHVSILGCMGPWIAVAAIAAQASTLADQLRTPSHSGGVLLSAQPKVFVIVPHSSHCNLGALNLAQPAINSAVALPDVPEKTTLVIMDDDTNANFDKIITASVTEVWLVGFDGSSNRTVALPGELLKRMVKLGFAIHFHSAAVSMWSRGDRGEALR